jgi:peptide/nickel transport system permease protein
MIAESHFEVVIEPEQATVRGVSYWGLVWRRLLSDPVAVICLTVIAALILVAIFAPLVAPYGYNELNPLNSRQGPSWQHWAGTDELGRDILSRLIFSLRNALIVAVGATVVAVIIGSVIGATAGYRGGTLDTVLVGVIDIMYAFPSFLFNVILIVVIGRGIVPIFIAIALTSWVGLARLMRAQVLAVRNREFVEAARALGASQPRVVLRYVIPNAIAPLVVAITFLVPSAMLTEGALAVLGMGLPPPRPSWGDLIATGTLNMRAFPYQLYIPAGSFALVLLAFTYLGDSVSRAVNPKE